MDARLTVRGQTLYAMSAEARQIAAADGSRKWVVAEGISVGASSARGLSYAATLEHVAWHDEAAIAMVPVRGGAHVRVTELGMRAVQVVTADDDYIYFARDDDDGGSVVGCIDAHHATHAIAKLPGSVDVLVKSGDYLAWAVHGNRDVYSQRVRDGIATGPPSLVYTAPAAFAMCAAEPGEVVIATAQSLARLALADGDLVRIAPTREMTLAPGTPTGIAWQAGLVYVARERGEGLGRIVERVEHASAAIVHALALDDDAQISYLVATEAGAFWIETRAGSEARLVHVARDAAAVAQVPAIPRTRTPSIRPAREGIVDRVRTTARTMSYSDLDEVANEARERANPALPRTMSGERIARRSSQHDIVDVPANVRPPSSPGTGRAPTSPGATRRAPTSGGSTIDTSGGRMRATVGNDASCTELVRRIAADAPHRLDLTCDGVGTAFSEACRGKELDSLRALVCVDIGDLADVLAAMAALEHAYVTGAFALEPIAHASLRELHLASDRLDPNLAGALMSSQLPVLERCALSFARVSTAGLLGMVKGMLRLAAPALREVHLGALRGPDQIRDVINVVNERGKPASWELLSFGGDLADEEAAAPILDALHPPAGLRIALRLADMYSEPFVAMQLRRKKWLCDLRDIGWRPCDPRAHAAW